MHGIEDPMESEQGVERISTLRIIQPGTVDQKRLLIRILSGPDAGKGFPAFLLGTRMTIGTSGNNDLVLSDVAVSRHHAELVQKEGNFMLKDLGSTNGSFVEGVQIQEARVLTHSRIRLGRTELQLLTQSDDSNRFSSSESFFTGHHPLIRKVLETVSAIANSTLTVLITGETGTGKELVARSIHTGSERKSAPMVIVDCSTIPEHLMESELFGHEKGAFTGATTARKGAFELAHGGTVFLDEIGELDWQLQPKLLRVLDCHEFKPVGSSKTVSVDVRVLAATNRDLKQEVKQGRFRGDLYYRLCGLEIGLPALRERLEDIPVLVDHFVHQVRSKKSFSPDAIRLMMEYHWPGNVRQLRNTIERALVLCKGDVLEAEGIQPLLPISGKTGPPASSSLIDIERSAIIQALKLASGNKSEAARKLGIAYSTLFEKMRKFGLR